MNHVQLEGLPRGLVQVYRRYPSPDMVLILLTINYSTAKMNVFVHDGIKTPKKQRYLA